MRGQKMRASSAEKIGSKMVKGIMPPEGGITYETPTGRAVGGFVIWHNFFAERARCYAIYYRFEDFRAKDNKKLA